MTDLTAQQAATQRQNAARATKPKLPVIFLTGEEAVIRDKLVAIYGSQSAAVKAAMILLAEKHGVA